MSHGSADGAPAAQVRPLLTVVRGEPTAAELAALTVVIGAMARRSSQRPGAEQASTSQWAARDRMVRPLVAAGPGAWRASALPR
jgi:Acyl-CoA carboxylase epsilon subunit